MKKRWIWIGLGWVWLALLGSGCGTAISSQSQEMRVTQARETFQALPTNPPADTATIHPTNTNVPTRAATMTPTSIPSRTPWPSLTPSPTPSPDQAWAVNNAASQASADVELKIVRLEIGYKSAFPGQNLNQYNGYVENWAELEVVGRIVIEVTNHRKHTVVVHPERGWLTIGDEAISLDEYTFLFGPEFGDKALGGELYPGQTERGEIWFGIRASTPLEITEIIYQADAPWDALTPDYFGPDEGLDRDYYIKLVVRDHTWIEE